MTDDLHDQVRAVALTNALHRVSPDRAAELGDSLSFARRLEGVNPGRPDFDAVVADAVRQHCGAADEAAAAHAAAAERERTAAEAATRARLANGQWTRDDVDACRDPEALSAAYHRGQLASIGMTPKPRPGLREVARPIIPGPALVARWNRMPPWQAQRARAEWKRQAAGRAAGNGGHAA